MNKDIIYIDVEDDITAIIGKVKDARQKIVALVPPKRIGVLQSAVNLRLLARAANQSDKHLVIISSNPALISLAAAAKLPVAKNLQSKPEIAEIAALDVDDGEDVIDGAQLPVGELARTADTPGAPLVAVHNPAIDSAIEENAAEDTPRRAAASAAGGFAAKARAKSGIKVPNFNDFRKKLALIIAGGILLIGFLVWGIFFAPRATVEIAARTTDSSVNNKVTFAPDVSTSLADNTIKLVPKETKKTESVEFVATGKKEVGEKATGTVVFSTDSISALGKTIPAGTPLTSTSGLSYVTNESVTMTTSNFRGAPTVVTAADRGAKYNGATGAVSGAPSGISATFQGSTSGGTDKTITVVAQEDVQKATEQLKQPDMETIRKQLTAQLDKDVVVIEQTFKASDVKPVAVPAVGQEVAEGVKPKLTSEISYSISGVEKDELNDYLDAHFAKQLEGLSDQRIYKNGADKVTFTNINAIEKGFTGNIVATAQIGPKIEDAVIKDRSKGKRYGEIQQSLEAVQGIESVDVKFWPFWVTTAPNDAKRINVEFKLNESN